MSQITTHILDTSRGMPVQDVIVTLHGERGTTWDYIATGATDQDGRAPDLLEPGIELPPGIYKLKFETQHYFDQLNIPTFYPFVEVIFHISGPEHYHVPLLLTPFGYSTYRGS